jgi:23S rRNA (uracil1939-C5)-methyltransferase
MSYSVPALIPAGCNSSCPGCSHRSLQVDQSLLQKKSFLKKILEPWGEQVQEVRSISSENRLGYRDKIILNVRWTNNNWAFGMMKRDELIPIPDCPVHTPMANRLIKLLTKYLPGYPLFPLAYFLQCRGQLTLVLKTKNPGNPDWLNEELQKEFEEIGLEGLWLHSNPSAGKRIFEKTPRTLIWGKAWSRDEYGMLYGPRSFQQLIPALYHQSLEISRAWLRPTADTAVIDLYCGTGNSMRYWAEAGAEIVGVELGGEANECARVNVPSAYLLRGKCEERIPQLEDWRTRQEYREKKLLVYANPPRTGIDAKTLDWIIKAKPERIAYLSCSPGTLRKNLDSLALNKYEVKGIRPFDFFPLTRHVETLVLLELLD